MDNHIPVRVVEPNNEKAYSSFTKPKSKIYVRAVRGFYDNFRKVSGLLFLILFTCIPWLSFEGRQAVLLDFEAQRFHLFGMTLWPQDLTLFAWLFIIAAFALFFLTAIMGRVWCGFVCPQTVFTYLFVWIEEKVEGSRNKRIHLDKQKFGADKLIKKVIKHFIWVVIALITALTFVGYFYPVDFLFQQFFNLQLGFWPLFYVTLFALCTYINAGWMREIMCTHICPYARFQSSMFDADTLTVTYNRKRGEGRGPRSKKLTKHQYQANNLGDCIDCNLCVQVCPTGIDIRNGLQYECINCGACIDACNGVMDKMNYKRGLISYTSEKRLLGNATKLLRPNVVGYFITFAFMSGLLIHNIYNKPNLDIDVIRDRNTLYRENLQGVIENSYTLVVMNKTLQKQHYRVEIRELPGGEIIGRNRLTVEPNDLFNLPLSVAVKPEDIQEKVTPFVFSIINQNNEQADQQSTFIYQ